jgi:hypothetical protein
MLETKKCHQCGEEIEIGQNAARMKNPAVGEIGYIYFHQRGRGDCYWQFLRDTIVKSRRMAEAGSYQFT